MFFRSTYAALAVLCGCAAACAAELQVSVADQSGAPVAGVRVELTAEGVAAGEAETDAKGHAAFTGLKAGHYDVQASGAGLTTAAKKDLDLSQAGDVAVEFTMAPAPATQESVDVHATVDTLGTASSSAPEQVPPQTAKELPSRPATVSDALPMIPGVVRSPSGQLQISGAGEQRSALIVNSADVTDPATGQFGLTVPIDSVESLNVYQTPFLAEYGRFSAGLVSVETRRGGEKWKWELNDPFPDFRIRSYRMQGIKDATPRVNAEGPLVPGKLYFSEGLEYEIRKTSVITLPYPDNQKKQQGVNSFAQMDWVVSDKQLVTGTVHVAPQRLSNVGIDYFHPEATAPEAATQNYTATIADRYTLGGGLLENTVSATHFDARVWGQGNQDLTLMPEVSSGNYFAAQNRRASRMGLLTTYSFRPMTGWGEHNIKIGSYAAGSSEEGQVTERPINLLDANGVLLERISFTGGRAFHDTDTEFAFFAQDHWIVSPTLALDAGLRAESQQAADVMRLAPRVGVAWTPLPRQGTTIRAGFGLFYDRVPLNVYSFDHYPNQVVTMYDPMGQISAGPFFYTNGLAEVDARMPFVFRELRPGNFSPRSATWSFQVEQPLFKVLKLRVGYMQSNSSGLVILNQVAADALTRTGALLLSGNGQARYHQFETTARVRLGTERELFFSYVRSRSRGNVNDFTNYLGSFPLPIVQRDQFGNLPGDLPNRFLAWGLIRLPARMRIAPVVEARNGFAYSALDVFQNYVGAPNQNRFPTFLSVDARLSKDFQVNPKYTVRLSVSGFNLTKHFNPEAVHANVSDPAYAMFFGQHGRRFTADFDVLF